MKSLKQFDQKNTWLDVLASIIAVPFLLIIISTFGTYIVLCDFYRQAGNN